MSFGISQVPPTVNEPVRSYAPGSPERAALKAELARQSDTTVNIPLRINGKAVETGKTLPAVMPHKHAHVLGHVHQGGKAEVEAPVYSHLVYDIVPDEKIVVRQPDILIVEGLNVLQPPVSTPWQPTRSTLTVSDFFDFSVYVDARETDIREWYINRFLRLRETAFADPDSYFHRYARLDDDEAVTLATRIWESINLPNLIDNVQPTRGRATAILRKSSNHAVDSVKLRKL